MELKHRIEAQIEQESDPNERARLMIMHQVAGVLQDTAAAVREMAVEFRNHRKEFEDHIVEEQRIVQSGKILWKIAGIIMLGLQGLFGFWMSSYIKTIDSITDKLGATAAQVDRAHARIDIINERYNYIEKDHQRLVPGSAPLPPQP